MVVQAFGKINLYLDVLDRRSDGFTNIETIFQTVNLFDTLTFETRDCGLSLACSNSALETGDANLAIRAAKLLQDRTGFDKGAHIHLEKRIPIAGGMAGGSVDAAATLRALNELWGLNLSHAALVECALELGSDVPYCLIGGTIAATGRGEVLAPLDPLPETWFVLVQPPLEISAGAAYNHPALTRNNEMASHGVTSSFDRSLGLLKKGQIADIMFNRMESAILAMHPELSEMKQRLVDAGCLAAIVSGSGPTVVGLCESQEHAAVMSSKLKPLASTPVCTVASAMEFQ